MKLQFIGHSAFYLETDDAEILIDPFISQNPVADFDIEKHKITDILVTHAHADHLGDAIPISKKTGATITAVFELANYCLARGAKVQGVNIGGRVPFPWGDAWFLKALHSSSTVDGVYGGCPASILIEAGGVKIFHAGDTGLHYDMKMIGEVYKPDIAILPVGGFYTMGEEEALIAAEWLGAKTVIPMHYNTFEAIAVQVDDFKKKLEASYDSKCLPLLPGETITI